MFQRPKGPNRAPKNGTSFHDPRTVMTYDPSSSSWDRLATGGNVPRPTAGAFAVLVADVLYVFGGFVHWDQNTDSQEMSGDLYTLDMEHRLWTRLSPPGSGVSWR